MQLEQEKRTLHQLQRQYNAALSTVNAQIAMLQAKGQTPSRQNRIAYQKQLKEQLEATIAKLHSETYQTIEQFMNDSYTTGYVGAMYDLHGQGLPVIAPIDKDAVVKAVMTDTKLKHGVYRELGSDMATLKKKISNELTRGIATGMAYDDIARNIRMATGAPKARANAIVRTEGHRIQQASQEDARQLAKSKGADVVKQWDATLDSATRDSHRKLDGQIREVDEPFEINGLSAMYPGEFGDPAEDCNCRCVALTRARAALDDDELKTMQERAKTFKLDKTKNFEDFKEKYLKAADESDDEFDVFSFFEENDTDVLFEETDDNDYPEALQLTTKEQEILQDEDVIFETGEMLMASQGRLDDESVKRARERYTKQLHEAERMIEQRKTEGYKFDKVAAKARREMNKELAYEEGRHYVGENGIRHWQSSRNDARRKLELLELAEKLQKRKSYEKR